MDSLVVALCFRWGLQSGSLSAQVTTCGRHARSFQVLARAMAGVSGPPTVQEHTDKKLYCIPIPNFLHLQFNF
eukprot:5300620-Amphidinium_carterae.1